MSDKPHVLIAGGGIAGPALALFLNKAGISSEVFEAYGPGTAAGAGLGLAPNGMNVLAALGVAERLKAAGSLALVSNFRDGRGRLLAQLSTEEARYGQPVMSMMRADIHSALADAMAQQGLVIQYNKRLAAVTEIGAGVIARFADGTEARGDLLIGADGIHSRTRELIMPDAPRPEFVGITGIGGRVVRIAVPALSAQDAKSFNFVFGPQGFFGYCGGSAGEEMWWSNLPRDRPYSDEELKALSPDTLRAQMLQRYGGYSEPVPSLIAKSTDIMALNIFDIQSLPRWHEGRVMLIGDAAHAVSPNAGQGASLALEDAMYLAKLLRDCPDCATAFACFERDRKPRVERIVAAGRRAASDKTIVSPLKSRIRNIMIGLMLRLFGIPGQDWAYRYRIHWK